MMTKLNLIHNQDRIFGTHSHNQSIAGFIS